MWSWERLLRADDEIRTRDPHLGKVMLYQLSHVRSASVPGGAVSDALRTIAQHFGERQIERERRLNRACTTPEPKMNGVGTRRTPAHTP